MSIKQISTVGMENEARKTYLTFFEIVIIWLATVGALFTVKSIVSRELSWYGMHQSQLKRVFLQFPRTAIADTGFGQPVIEVAGEHGTMERRGRNDTKRTCRGRQPMLISTRIDKKWPIHVLTVAVKG